MGRPRGKPFVKGYDPRRHQFTDADRTRGYMNAPSWIKSRIRGLYKKGVFKRCNRGAYPYPEDIW